MAMRQIRWLPARRWWLIHQKGHAVVFLLKEYNQLNVTVGTVGRLGTTQECARETQLSLLHQRLARIIYFQVVLVVIMMILHDELPVPSISVGFAGLSVSVVLYVSISRYIEDI
jgi:hypothetical protein